MKRPGLDRKVLVVTDWTLDLVLPPDIVQLKTGQDAIALLLGYLERPHGGRASLPE